MISGETFPHSSSKHIYAAKILKNFVSKKIKRIRYMKFLSLFYFFFVSESVYMSKYKKLHSGKMFAVLTITVRKKGFRSPVMDKNEVEN
jgi:hypothetical protein